MFINSLRVAQGKSAAARKRVEFMGFIYVSAQDGDVCARIIHEGFIIVIRATLTYYDVCCEGGNNATNTYFQAVFASISISYIFCNIFKSAFCSDNVLISFLHVKLSISL